MPLVSVIIPTYNRAHLLPRALNSLQSQTAGDFEVVVVDDGSTDETEKVVREMSDRRIRYVHQENAGAAAARNRGVGVARGAYVAFLDSDDEVTPRWMSALNEAFEKHDADIVCCGYERVSEKGESQEVVLPRKHGAAFNFIRGMFFGAFVMRKSIVEAIGGYSEDLPAGQLTDLALRLAWHPSMSQWKIHNIMEPLVVVHKYHEARIRNNLRARYQGGRRLLEVHESKLRRDPTSFANMCGSVGVNAFRLGRRGEARRLFLQAVQADPTDWKRWARVVMAYVVPVGERVWN